MASNYGIPVAPRNSMYGYNDQTNLGALTPQPIQAGAQLTYDPMQAQVDQDQLARRQKYADALREKAMSDDYQQQTAGGYVIPYNPLQGLTKLLNAYSYSHERDSITDKKTEIEQAKNQKVAEILRGYKNQPLKNMSLEDEQILANLDPTMSKILETRRNIAEKAADRAVMQQQGVTPFYQFLQTPEGYMAGNARTGGVAPVIVNGKPVIPSQSSPTLQGQIAGAKEAGKSTAESQVKLPQVVANAQDLSRHIDEMIGAKDGTIPKHSGMDTYLNTAGMAGSIPKTDAADFKARFDQLQGGAFLQAFNSLRGGGQITEVEGAKATAALNRAKGALTEKAFTNAMRDFQQVVNDGVQRASAAAQGQYNATPTGYPSAPMPIADNDPLGLRR